MVEQAADATATSFELEVFDASGAAVTPAYNAPLQSVGGRDGNGRQTVVFGTDSTKLGGTFRFKVGSGPWHKVWPRGGLLGWHRSPTASELAERAVCKLCLAPYCTRTPA